MTGRRRPRHRGPRRVPNRNIPTPTACPNLRAGRQKRYSSGQKSRPRIDNRPSRRPSNAPLFAAIPEDPQPRPMTSSVGTHQPGGAASRSSRSIRARRTTKITIKSTFSRSWPKKSSPGLTTGGYPLDIQLDPDLVSSRVLPVTPRRRRLMRTGVLTATRPRGEAADIQVAQGSF